jgi:predicted ribosome quality control (RQC) complex YloA/Tae2 family protein
MVSIEIPGITLHHFVTRWNSEWKSAFVTQFRAIGENTFLFKLSLPQKKGQLLVKLPGLITETTRHWEISETQPRIIKEGKKFVENARIHSISQHGLDRVLIIACDKCSIIIELFGSGNIIFTDSTNKILAAHEMREWKHRTIRPAHPYLFPPGPIPWDELPTEIEKSEWNGYRSIGAWLVQKMGVPSVLVTQLTAALKMNLANLTELSPADWKKMRKELECWYASQPKEFVCVYPNDHCVILPPEYAYGEKISEVFDFIDNQLVTAHTQPPKNEKGEHEKKALENALEKQEKQLGEWGEESSELQKSGEYIYAHFDVIEELLKALRSAKKQKTSNEKIVKEWQVKLKKIKKIDWEKNEVEWETET